MGRKKLKVVMLGEGRVGKTSLLHRFINNTFDEECASTQKATMYANTKVEVGDITADVSIWDTAGQERYHALGPIWAAQHDAQHFYCSAKLGLKVSEAFTSLVKAIVEKSPTEGNSKTRDRSTTGSSSSTPAPPRSKGVKIAQIDEAPPPRVKATSAPARNSTFTIKQVAIYFFTFIYSVERKAVIKRSSAGDGILLFET